MTVKSMVNFDSTVWNCKTSIILCKFFNLFLGFLIGFSYFYYMCELYVFIQPVKKMIIRRIMVFSIYFLETTISISTCGFLGGTIYKK